MFPRSRRTTWLTATSLLILALLAASPLLLRIPAIHALRLRITGKSTVDQRLTEYADPVRSRLAPRFAAVGLEYPPASITLVALK